MHIRGFHIDGFGIFHDQGVQDIPGGFVLFSGLNESGKTTLMEYFRTILFGFLRRKSRNSFPPLRGGNHGGRLRVVMRDGREYTIERLGKDLTVAGEDGDDAELERLLGGIDRETFERIFAINARDLQGLDWLSQDSVRSRLLAASIGAGAESVPSTLESLTGEIGDLLKARQAKRPLINDRVRQLREIDQSIRELQTKPIEYAELQQECTQLEDRIARKRKMLEWLERLGRQRKALEEAVGIRKDCESRIQQLEEQLSRISVDQIVIGHAEAIKKLMGEKGRLITELTEYPGLVDEMRGTEEEIQEKIDELGLGWSLERILELDTSDQMRQSINEFESRLNDAEREYKLKQDRQQIAEDAERKAKLALEEAQQDLDALVVPAIIDTQELEQKQNLIRELRSLLYQRDNTNVDLRGKRGIQQAEKARLEPIKDQMRQQADQFPSKAYIAVFAVGGAGVIVTILSLILGIYLPGVVPGVLVSTVGIGLGIWLFNSYRGQLDAKARDIKELQAKINDIEQADRDSSAEIEEQETELASIAEQMEALSQKLGVQMPGDVDEIEGLESELKRETEQLNGWLAQNKKKDAAEENWHGANEQLRQATQEAKDAHRKLQQVELEWQRWLAEHGFAEAITTADFREMLGKAKDLQRTEKARQEIRQRADQTEAYLSRVQTSIRNELGACGIEPSSDQVGEADLDALERTLDAALEKQRERRELERQLRKEREDLEGLREQVDEKQAAVEERIQQADTMDEGEFHGVIELDEQSLKEYLRELGEQVLNGNKKIGKLTSDLEKMAQNERLGELLFTRQTLQVELADLTKQWATRVVCRHLMSQTRDIYERDRQPKVVQEATRFINTMTPMPYRLVMPVGKDDDVEVEDDTAFRKSEIGWSSGLADQVYLSMRLACAQDFAENAEPLPLILDDVLLTFDPGRQLGAAKVVLDLAQRHQILMFTCQPGVKEITQRALEECDFRDNVSFTCYTISKGKISRES
jgi:uncharacterized protein YhaN